MTIDYVQVLAYLDGLLEAKGVLLSETDAGPLEHLCLLSEVGNRKGLVLGQERFVPARDQVVDLVEEIPAALDPLLSF